MNAAEIKQVRGEVGKIILALKARGQRPDPARFSPLLTRALTACRDADDVLALTVACVRSMPAIGPLVAGYIARNREAVLAELAPQFRLLKGGEDADAA